MSAAIAAPEPAGTLPRALLVAGPTCSGKSALALALAQRLGGVVINADSMQVYRELRILTARPTPEDESLAPHALYGVRPAAEPGNVAWWRQAVLAEMQAARCAGRLPILCGGTGMYFAALTQGLADIPPPDAASRLEARRLLAALGANGLHARLAQADPQTAAGLRPTDGQRLARAWEVLVSTGRGLTHWQAAQGPPAPWSFRAVLIDPPRPELRQAIARRSAGMVEAGAIEEVRALLALGLDKSLPAMRAHGVPELGAYLAGVLGVQQAVARIALVTGQYTKRQATWFRQHTLAPPRHTRIIGTRISYAEQLSARELTELQNFVLGLC